MGSICSCTLKNMIKQYKIRDYQFPKSRKYGPYYIALIKYAILSIQMILRQWQQINCNSYWRQSNTTSATNIPNLELIYPIIHIMYRSSQMEIRNMSEMLCYGKIVLKIMRIRLTKKINMNIFGRKTVIMLSIKIDISIIHYLPSSNCIKFCDFNRFYMLESSV